VEEDDITYSLETAIVGRDSKGDVHIYMITSKFNVDELNSKIDEMNNDLHNSKL